MFIKYSDGKFLGVSLKVGGKKTSEPQLNTYVRPVFTAFGETRMMETLRSTAYAQVYSKIKGMHLLVLMVVQMVEVQTEERLKLF